MILIQHHSTIDSIFSFNQPIFPELQQRL